MSLEGRVALITGSTGRGMGRSIALTLARDRADVALNYETRPERAERMRAQLQSMGRRASLHQADVATEEGARSVFEGAVRELGRVDILVLSAGGAWQARDIVETPPEHWRRVLAEEVHAPLYLIPLALPAMRNRGWGRIVLIGGYDADDFREEWPLDYPLGKTARHWLTRTLARSELKHGITVNAIAPGDIPYVELDAALSDVARGERWQTRIAPTPQDAGEVVSFLCSDAGRFVTGTIVNIVPPKPTGPG